MHTFKSRHQPEAWEPLLCSGFFARVLKIPLQLCEVSGDPGTPGFAFLTPGSPSTTDQQPPFAPHYTSALLAPLWAACSSAAAARTEM